MKTYGDNTYWNDFFLAVSNVFAFAEESSTLSDYSELGLLGAISRIHEFQNKYNILKSLEAMAFTDIVSRDNRFKEAYYILMDLDFSKKECSVFCVKEEDFESAMAEYIKYESDKTRKHSAVFVAVSDFNKLKDAYPNYFVDLNKFSSMIKFMLENSKNEVKI